MAAPDNESRQNRRRVLKAISTAPVVATLHSGSAFATASAYQCIDNDDPVIRAFLPSEDPGSTNAKYVYELHDWWEVTSVPDPTCDSRIVVGTRIVGIGNNGTVQYVTFDGDVITSDVVLLQNDTLQIGGTTPGKLPCGSTGPRQANGKFLLFVEPVKHADNGGLIPANPSEATGIEIQGIYPVKQSDGVNQGITGTCLVSVNPGANLGLPRTLSRG
jgi:hypothetical protein